MTDQELEALKYPIGKNVYPKERTPDCVREWIEVLERFPKQLENLIKNLNDEQLDTPYRPKGWTVRQVIHHLSDSHHHSYSRFKWAMTEDNPTIKAYDELAWSELHDYSAPIETSLLHLKVVHSKLVYFIRGLSEQDLERTFVHPDGNKRIALKENLCIYAWHSKHHYAHIQHLMVRKGWH